MSPLPLLLLLLGGLRSCAAAQDGNPATFGTFQDGRYDGHPMLFFSRRDAEGMRAAASASSHGHIVARLQEAARTMMERPVENLPPWDNLEFGAIWNEIYGNNLAPMAFYSFLEPRDAAARAFTLDFMDRMAAQPNWLVTLYPKDEVPIGHSLAGFATAYDLMHEHLNTERKSRYLSAIVNATKDMYEMSFVRGWGFQYLQNHQPTNTVAMLMGALVVMTEGYHAEAAVWVKQATSIMEKSMFMTDEVTDGSLNEGLAYGSYLDRSLLKYIFLAKRHFNVSHGDSVWLNHHFEFYYRSIQPGFQRTVGIADSNYNWYYGPEAQLAFLDTFVLRNGSGNWLGRTIAELRPRNGTGASVRAHRWCTLHLEFIWYDATLPPSPPADYGTPSLHHFRSWGVVTYGSPQPAVVNSTFFAFKSGKVGGAAVNDIVRERRYPEWVEGWRNFNPGHEHPDQNTLVFSPNGVPFISEGLYGPKYTWHSNVLMFDGGPEAGRTVCKPPWVGQVVETCNWNWVTCERTTACDYNGRVVAAAERDGAVFVRGEATEVYDAALGLGSVLRDAVLLEPQLLLAVDHVALTGNGSTERAAAFFHNLDWSFEAARTGGLNGAKIPRPDGDYELYWADDRNASPLGLMVDEPYPPGFQIKGTHYVQIEFALHRPLTRLVYVFLGPAMALDSMAVVPRPDSVDVVLRVNGQTYSVRLNSERAVADDGEPYCVVEHEGAGGRREFRPDGSAGQGNSTGYKGDHVERLAKTLQSLDVVFEKIAQDVDECVDTAHGCEQLCVNTIGSFRCACRPGFHLDTDGTACLVSPSTAAPPTTKTVTSATTAKQTTSRGPPTGTPLLPTTVALLAATVVALGRTL